MLGQASLLFFTETSVSIVAHFQSTTSNLVEQVRAVPIRSSIENVFFNMDTWLKKYGQEDPNIR